MNSDASTTKKNSPHISITEVNISIKIVVHSENIKAEMMRLFLVNCQVESHVSKFSIKKTVGCYIVQLEVWPRDTVGCKKNVALFSRGIVNGS